ncbi:MAG TPA: OmpA family protein [Candidatus Angelobacter sp.]|jgi:outer membrane protein OmpA-like peptidoglycan-associated protein
MKDILRLLLYCTLLLTAQALFSQDQDAEGCKDSTMITRLPGSTIHSCENKEFDQAKLPLGTDKDGNAKEKTIEGEYHYWDYGTREGVSEIQVFRNFETALKKAGFTLDYEESPGTITAHKGSTWYWLQNSGSYYYQTIVIEKAMQQEVTADDMAGEINKSGHVAVYGIHFDTGKATIQPDSENVLDQIVKLLQQSSDLKLRVEGHTDNQGNAAANQTLSEKRAQAVVTWLTSKGISASRLAAKGYGATKPVADNTTEDGRAKNRRVELVKM